MAAQAHTTPAAPSATVPASDSDVSRLNAGASRLRALHDETMADDHLLTVQKAAELDWQPWTGDCPVPSDRDWPGIGAYYLPLARMAWLMNCKSKEALIECFAKMDNDDPDRVQKVWTDLQNALDYFTAFRDLLETADLRIGVALSTMTVDPHYSCCFSDAAKRGAA